MLTRREMMAGAGALTLVPGRALASSGVRRFDLIRAGDPIGTKSVSVVQDGARVSVRTEIAIAVRILGLTAYSYRLNSDEVWQDGRLIRLDARTDDNGTPHFARAERSGDALRVEGSEYAGPVAGNPGTTSYWAPALLQRQVWISTQDGRPWRVSATRAGAADAPGASGGAVRWRIGGELAGLDLFYDSAGEWVGSEFDARGERARFVLSSRGAALTPLWVGG